RGGGLLHGHLAAFHEDFDLAVVGLQTEANAARVVDDVVPVGFGAGATAVRDGAGALLVDLEVVEDAITAAHRRPDGVVDGPDQAAGLGEAGRQVADAAHLRVGEQAVALVLLDRLPGHQSGDAAENEQEDDENENPDPHGGVLIDRAQRRL